MATKSIAAGAFKQGCLALIDEVADSKSEIVITKRGKPIARLVPIEAPQEHERRLLERWRGKGKQLVSDAELLAPSSMLVRWGAGSEEEP